MRGQGCHARAGFCLAGWPGSGGNPGEQRAHTNKAIFLFFTNRTRRQQTVRCYNVDWTSLGSWVRRCDLNFCSLYIYDLIYANRMKFVAFIVVMLWIRYYITGLGLKVKVTATRSFLGQFSRWIYLVSNDIIRYNIKWPCSATLRWSLTWRSITSRSILIGSVGSGSRSLSYDSARRCEINTSHSSFFTIIWTYAFGISSVCVSARRKGNARWVGRAASSDSGYTSWVRSSMTSPVSILRSLNSSSVERSTLIRARSSFRQTHPKSPTDGGVLAFSLKHLANSAVIYATGLGSSRCDKVSNLLRVRLS